MERMHKHIIGAKMINTSMDLFTHITLANKNKEERLKHLDNFLTVFLSACRAQMHLFSSKLSTVRVCRFYYSAHARVEYN